MKDKVEDLRITKLRDYLVKVVEELEKSKGINADALGKTVGEYSLDKIPTDYEVEKWICGTEIHRDVFSFRSRKNYSYNEIDNLNNIGFFEKFENIISSNNKKGILPDIEGIESIQCLNTGALQNAQNGTAEFAIQVQITYIINY